jgi:hypothetical protein
MPRFETKRKRKFQFNIQTDLVTIQVLDIVVNKPFRDCHLHGQWLLYGNCPLTTGENIKPSKALVWQ